MIDELRSERLIGRKGEDRRASAPLHAMRGACAYDPPPSSLSKSDLAWLASWRAIAGASVSAEADDVFDVDVLSPEEALARAELLTEVDASLCALEASHRAVLEAVLLEGKTLAEAAPHWSKSWASRRLGRALEELRDRVRERGFEISVKADPVERLRVPSGMGMASSTPMPSLGSRKFAP